MPTEKILLPPCSCFDKIIRFRFCQIGNHLIFRSFTASGRMSLPSTRSFMT